MSRENRDYVWIAQHAVVQRVDDLTVVTTSFCQAVAATRAQRGSDGAPAPRQQRCTLESRHQLIDGTLSLLGGEQQHKARCGKRRPPRLSDGVTVHEDVAEDVARMAKMGEHVPPQRDVVETILAHLALRLLLEVGERGALRCVLAEASLRTGCHDVQTRLEYRRWLLDVDGVSQLREAAHDLRGGRLVAGRDWGRKARCVRSLETSMRTNRR